MKKWRLLANYLAGEAPPKDKSEAEAMMQRNGALRSFFSSLQSFFKKSHFDFKQFKDQDWSKLMEKIYNQREDRPVIPFYQSTVFKVAASVVLILGIGVYTLISYDIEDNSLYYQSQDAKQEISLPDQSIVVLNKHSSIHVQPDYGKNERIIKLKGEAYFKVTKNPGVPFRVLANETITTVLGTAFNVRSEVEGQTKVVISVEEGHVNVFDISDSLTSRNLIAGDAVYVDRKNKISEIIPSDINFLAWKTGIIRFKNSTLREVGLFLSDYYSIEVDIDSKLNDLTITTELDNLSADESIEIIATTLNLRVDGKENIFRLHAAAN